MIQLFLLSLKKNTCFCKSFILVTEYDISNIGTHCLYK